MDKAWNSRRSPVYAMNGIVASSQPLASEAGLSILKRGGNAADAAVAVAAMLNVTQPTSTGLGGDAFALFYDAAAKSVKSINGSGRCPSGLSIDVFQELGYTESNRPPSTSPLFITVPGAAAAWVDTIERFGSGKLTLLEIMEPAMKLAVEGYPVNQVTAYYWARSEQRLLSASPNGREMLLNGAAPKVGEIMKMPNLANSMSLLGNFGKLGYYEGFVTHRIVEVIELMGGIMSEQDLANHTSTFEEPIHVNYRGVDIYECPPSGQGITALLAMNILEGFDIGSLPHNSAQHLHLVLECLRLAFADARFYVADPDFSPVPVQGMISKEYATTRRQLIDPDKAAVDIEHGQPTNKANTVYFSVVDGMGNACSFINSNYEGFGTCIVPRGCGFTLHNRGANFSLDSAHANSLQPNKRPYHTIIPGLAVRDGELMCPFGVMGGYMQPQGHLQVMSNMIDFNMDAQQALDSARAAISDGTANGRIVLEEGITEEVRDQLIGMGHNVNPEIVKGWNRSQFGVGQVITRNPLNGVLCGGSDPRNDGLAIGY